MISEKYVVRYRIDLNADPLSVPSGFEVVEHRKGGILHWNPYRPGIELYLTEGQRRGIVPGQDVLEELKDYEGTVVNANALDYFIAALREMPGMLPETWKCVTPYKSKHILFWGTLYRHEGQICVRSLEWNADARVQVWKAGFCWADHRLNSQFPAAMIRKPKPVATETA